MMNDESLGSQQIPYNDSIFKLAVYLSTQYSLTRLVPMLRSCVGMHHHTCGNKLLILQ